MATDPILTINETLAPYINLLKTSRPISSVPRRNSLSGAASKFPTVLFGGYGDITGASTAANIRSIKRIKLTMATLFLANLPAIVLK
ncbi:hypothetical protein SDC9_81308 [bioreactor metagenome]|uniref:Uncharacterized protein n=1 Tax=bioreactor metagenome TaxID=1076179 RepID=A0A644Z405_9ZZZZ